MCAQNLQSIQDQSRDEYFNILIEPFVGIAVIVFVIGSITIPVLACIKIIEIFFN